MRENNTIPWTHCVADHALPKSVPESLVLLGKLRSCIGEPATTEILRILVGLPTSYYQELRVTVERQPDALRFIETLEHAFGTVHDSVQKIKSNSI